MTAGFHVDPVRLRGTSPRFDAAADLLQDAAAALQAALAAEGPCWGGDQAGQTFQRNYLPQAEVTSNALATLVQALRGIRAGLDASAGTWDSCDQGAAGSFGGGGGLR